MRSRKRLAPSVHLSRPRPSASRPRRSACWDLARSLSGRSSRVIAPSLRTLFAMTSPLHRMSSTVCTRAWAAVTASSSSAGAARRMRPCLLPGSRSAIRDRQPLGVRVGVLDGRAVGHQVDVAVLGPAFRQSFRVGECDDGAGSHVAGRVAAELFELLGFLAPLAGGLQRFREVGRRGVRAVVEQCHDLGGGPVARECAAVDERAAEPWVQTDARDAVAAVRLQRADRVQGFLGGRRARPPGGASHQFRLLPSGVPHTASSRASLVRSAVRISGSG